MRLALTPHVRLAVLGDDVVLLDIRTDAYFCAPQATARLQPAEDRGSITPLDAESREALLAAGLALDGPPAPRPRLSPPARDLPQGPAPAASARDLWRLAGALWDLARRYRGRTFAEILDFAAAVPPPEVASPEAVLRLARLFHQVGPWLPIPDKCLVRSFVLLRFLQRSGVSARWMFGVRTWPFAAHCWLQLDDIVLDDAAARLIAYEPIHAVG